MIEIKGTISVALLKKETFTGSDHHMKKRFSLKKAEEEEGTVLEALLWEGPMIFQKSPKEKVKRETFPFTSEGIEQAVAWLNATEPGDET